MVSNTCLFIIKNLYPKIINSPIKKGQNFFLNYSSSKVLLIIMYADLVSTFISRKICCINELLLRKYQML